LNIEGQDIKYRLRQGNSRNYATIKFLSKGELDIILPRDNNVDVEALLKKKSSLIERKYHEFNSRQKILDGDRLFFRGKRYRLEILKNDSPPKKRISVQDGKILVVVSGEEDPATILKDWITHDTRRLVRRVLRRCTKHFETEPAEIKVKDTRRWGYCTRRGSLIFNWQLATLPTPIAEYVVLHELAHLSKFNHQRAFQNVLANLCPDYRKRELELRKFLTVESISLKQFP